MYDCSGEHGELRAEPGAGRDAARRQLGGHAGGAAVLGAPQPAAAHHAAAILRRGLHALQRHLLLRWRTGPVSLLIRQLVMFCRMRYSFYNMVGKKHR